MVPEPSAAGTSVGVIDGFAFTTGLSEISLGRRLAWPHALAFPVSVFSHSHSLSWLLAWRTLRCYWYNKIG